MAEEFGLFEGVTELDGDRPSNFDFVGLPVPGTGTLMGDEQAEQLFVDDDGGNQVGAHGEGFELVQVAVGEIGVEDVVGGLDSSELVFLGVVLGETGIGDPRSQGFGPGFENGFGDDGSLPVLVE